VVCRFCRCRTVSAKSQPRYHALGPPTDSRWCWCARVTLHAGGRAQAQYVPQDDVAAAHDAALHHDAGTSDDRPTGHAHYGYFPGRGLRGSACAAGRGTQPRPPSHTTCSMRPGASLNSPSSQAAHRTKEVHPLARELRFSPDNLAAAGSRSSRGRLLDTGDQERDETLRQRGSRLRAGEAFTGALAATS